MGWCLATSIECSGAITAVEKFGNDTKRRKRRRSRKKAKAKESMKSPKKPYIQANR